MELSNSTTKLIQFSIPCKKKAKIVRGNDKFLPIMPLLNIIFASSGISEATKSSSFPWSGSLFFVARRLRHLPKARTLASPNLLALGIKKNWILFVLLSFFRNFVLRKYETNLKQERKMKRIILSVLAFLPIMAGAQDTFTYSGERIDMQQHTFKSTLVGKLQGIEKQGYQGMDIWGQTVVSCQNTGVITLYNYDGRTLTKRGESFPMASNDKENHSNVVSMSRTFYKEGDPLPLIYVSQCSKGRYKGMKDVCFVERIKPELNATELVQTILYKDENKNFGYAVQWVLDNENGYLYGYGNTINNNDPQNRHRIVKFRIPEVKEGLVTLTDADLLENYLLEETYSQPFNPVGQGLFIKDEVLYMPTGFGQEKAPSILYVWDLKARRMRNVIDLTKATKGELEDCAAFGSALMIQAQGSMYRLDF